MRKIELSKKHVEYFNNVIPGLVKAEDTIDRIKHSKEWNEAINYFNTLVRRGYLKERPTRENNYKIEQMVNIDLPMYDKYFDYFNSVILEVINAEETINRIKHSQEWKVAYNYFTLMKHRGLLKSNPTKANKYKYEIATQRPQKRKTENANNINKCILMTWEDFSEIVETVSNNNVSICCVDGNWSYLETEFYNSEFINNDLSKYFKKKVRDVLIDVTNDNNCVVIVFN